MNGFMEWVRREVRRNPFGYFLLSVLFFVTWLVQAALHFA